MSELTLESLSSDIKWRPINGYEGYYEISNFGSIRSCDRVIKRNTTGSYKKHANVMKLHITPKGYLRVQLVKDGQHSNFMVHRLVAKAFVENTEAKLEVNHIDGNKQNNCWRNLEWVNSSENQRHAYKTGLRQSKIKYIVYCEEEDITTFGIDKMVEKLRILGYTNVCASGIWHCLAGTNKTHSNLHFISCVNITNA